VKIYNVRRLNKLVIAIAVYLNLEFILLSKCIVSKFKKWKLFCDIDYEFYFTKIVYKTASRIDLCIIYYCDTSKYISIKYEKFA